MYLPLLQDFVQLLGELLRIRTPTAVGARERRHGDAETLGKSYP
jgi:hypothetical protein